MVGCINACGRRKRSMGAAICKCLDQEGALLQEEKARQLPVQREKVAKIMSLSGLLVRRVRIQQLAVM